MNIRLHHESILHILIIFSLLLFGILVHQIEYPNNHDGYFHLRMVEMMQELGHYPVEDMYSSYPHRPFNYPPGYHYALYILSQIITNSWLAWKLMPLLSLTLTLPLIYYAGKTLHSENTGLFAALSFILLPHVIIEIFKPDNTLFNHFLTAFAFACLLYYRTNKSEYTALLFGTSLGLYLCSWYGSLFYVLLFGSFFIFETFKDKRLENTKYLLWGVAPIFLLPAFIMPQITFGCWDSHVEVCPLDKFEKLPFGPTIFKAMSNLGLITKYDDSYTPPIKRYSKYVSELQFIPEIIPDFFGPIFYLLLPTFIIYLSKREYMLPAWLLSASLILIPQGVKYLNFVYIPSVLIFGYSLDKLYSNSKTNKFFFVALTTYLLFVTYVNYPLLETRRYELSPDLVEAGKWIRNNAENKTFMNYWPDGHYIAYNRGINVIDGLLYSGRVDEDRTQFLYGFWTLPEGFAWYNLWSKDIDYVWVRKSYISTSNTFAEMSGWNESGYKINGREVVVSKPWINTFLTKALGPQDFVCFNRVFRNNEVTIFKVNDECILNPMLIDKEVSLNTERAEQP